jgi:hypothetical protein
VDMKLKPIINMLSRPRNANRSVEFILLLITSFMSFGLHAQGEPFQPDSSQSSSGDSDIGSSTTQAEDDDNIIRAPKQANPPQPRQFTATETRKVCAKFQGSVLSVFGEIYKVKDCTRHQIHDQSELFKLAKQGVKIIEVDSKEVAALPIGDSWEMMNTENRPCSFFNKKYITFSYTDIYFVENCVRKLIPDYITLIEHRKKQGIKSSEVLALNAREFYGIRQGRDISSVIDREFSKLLEGSAGVDIIPIDEACKGVEGRFVTFYSRMYKIEKCRKREINAEQFTMRRKTAGLELIELKPEQWVSMPDGKPFDDKK